MGQEPSREAQDEAGRMPLEEMMEKWQMGFQGPADDPVADSDFVEDDLGVQLDDV